MPKSTFMKNVYIDRCTNTGVDRICYVTICAVTKLKRGRGGEGEVKRDGLDSPAALNFIDVFLGRMHVQAVYK